MRGAPASPAPLLGALLDALPVGLRAAFAGAEDDVELTLAGLHRTGAEAWPTVFVEGEAFAAFVARRARPTGPAELLRVRAADLYLLAAFTANDPTAGELFRRHYLGRVSGALRKIGVVGPFAEEILQDTSQRALLDNTSDPERKHYTGSGDLAAWLCVTAVRHATKQRRSGAREPSAGDNHALERVADDGDDAELTYVKLRHKREFKEAFAEAVQSLTPEERNVLWYQVAAGLNIDQVGGIYGVHRATIARWTARARQKLLERTRLALMRRLRISTHEFESILRLLDSHMDLSIRDLFEE